MYAKYSKDYLAHHGIKGQRWGVRRFQNEDGTYNEKGKDRYGISDNALKPGEKIKDFANRSGAALDSVYSTFSTGSHAVMNHLKRETAIMQRNKGRIMMATAAAAGAAGAALYLSKTGKLPKFMKTNGAKKISQFVGQGGKYTGYTLAGMTAIMGTSAAIGAVNLAKANKSKKYRDYQKEFQNFNQYSNYKPLGGGHHGSNLQRSSSALWN